MVFSFRTLTLTRKSLFQTIQENPTENHKKMPKTTSETLTAYRKPLENAKQNLRNPIKSIENPSKNPTKTLENHTKKSRKPYKAPLESIPIFCKQLRATLILRQIGRGLLGAFSRLVGWMTLGLRRVGS